MSTVMTDEQIRSQMLHDLGVRAERFRQHAERERGFAFTLVPGQSEAEDEYLKYAAHYDRCAAHYQQAIDLLTAAPMPASEEGK